MKKIICILMMLILVLSLVACGGNDTPDGGDDKDEGGIETPGKPVIPDWGDGEGIETPIIPLP